MKKIIALLLSMVLMSSCTDVVYKPDGWAVPTNKRNRSEIDVTVFEYDGHTYLIFGRTTMTNGVVHDPNCTCHKEHNDE